MDGAHYDNEPPSNFFRVRCFRRFPESCCFPGESAVIGSWGQSAFLIINQVFSPPSLQFVRLSNDAVIECVLLGVVSPVGRRHAAVRVQQDAETANDEQSEENEEQQHEDESGFLLQRQVRRHVVAAARRGQGAAEQALGHPGHIHA